MRRAAAAMNRDFMADRVSMSVRKTIGKARVDASPREEFQTE